MGAMGNGTSRARVVSVQTPAVGQCKVDIGDPGPLVDEYQSYSASAAIEQDLPRQRAAAAVDEGVACQFTRSRDQLGLINQAETQLDSPLAYLLPREHDVTRGLQRQQLTLRCCHGMSLIAVCPGWCLKVPSPIRHSARSALPAATSPTRPG